MDVQESLFPLVFSSKKLLRKLLLVTKAAMAFNLPILVTEQYPQGVGKTIIELKKLLKDDAQFFEKTTFSGLQDTGIAAYVRDVGKRVWVLAGIEAHICVLQTARDLVNAGYEVIVLRDCIASRNLEDCHSSFFEFEKLGVRCTTAETLLFEFVGSKDSPYFEPLLKLVKDV
jgi:nicotinamidase-related amidase